jgi:hypothetical protein
MCVLWCKKHSIFSLAVQVHVNVRLPLQENKIISQWCSKWQKRAVLLHSHTWHKFLRCRKFEIFFSFPLMVRAGNATRKSSFNNGPTLQEMAMLNVCVFFSCKNQNTWQCVHWRSWGAASSIVRLSVTILLSLTTFSEYRVNKIFLHYSATELYETRLNKEFCNTNSAKQQEFLPMLCRKSINL